MPEREGLNAIESPVARSFIASSSKSEDVGAPAISSSCSVERAIPCSSMSANALFEPYPDSVHGPSSDF